MLPRMNRFLALAAVFLAAGFACSAEEAPLEAGAVVKLPKPRETGEVSVEEALAKRRSVRSFEGKALSREQLGALLWAAQGVSESERGLRTAPSAGALYPLEVFAVTPEGVWKYETGGHSIRLVEADDRRRSLSRAALNQTSVAQAGVSIVITGVYGRTEIKYGERARRYVDIEAGCAAENVMLQATAMRLGSVPIGAFDDRGVANVIGAREDERPILIIAVGRPSG